MLISIIIPVYNTQAYLKKCINSVIEQKFKDIEIICINDCSCDNSKEILGIFQRKDTRIKIINNTDNIGLSECRNVGIANAQGEYIMFLDSDDYLSDNALIDLKNKIMQENLDILFFGYGEHLLEDDNIVKRERIDYYPQILDGKDFFCSSRLNGTEIVTSWSAIYKKKFLLKNNLQFDNGLLHEDLLFYFKVLMKAKRVSSIRECCYEYVRRKNSITLSNDNIQAKIWSLSKIVYKINMYNDNLDENIKLCINDYLRDRIKTIIENYNKIDNFNFTKYPLDYQVDLVIKLISVMHYNSFFPYKLPFNIVLKIKNYKNVIIYGAGNVGRGLYQLLREYHIPIYLFAQSKHVSDLQIKQIYGIELKCIEDEIEKENTIILVAVKKESQIMVNNAKNLGFNNVIDLSKYA